MMTIKQRCQISGCRRAARWAFNATIGRLNICWYACDPHAKQHERDVGPVPLEKAKAR